MFAGSNNSENKIKTSQCSLKKYNETCLNTFCIEFYERKTVVSKCSTVHSNHTSMLLFLKIHLHIKIRGFGEH